MDPRWQEEQRAFQARVFTDESQTIALHPYRTFLGSPNADTELSASRSERFAVTIISGALVIFLLLTLEAPREIAAIVGSLTGGLALVITLTRDPSTTTKPNWMPLLAIYPSEVLSGIAPICVTEISIDEFERLGCEGFGTVVGNPKPNSAFGFFVDDYLVWPQSQPRASLTHDPKFGAP